MGDESAPWRIDFLDHSGHPDAALPVPRAVLAARLLMATLRRLDARADTAELRKAIKASELSQMAWYACLVI